MRGRRSDASTTSAARNWQEHKLLTKEPRQDPSAVTRRVGARRARSSGRKTVLGAAVEQACW